MARRQLLTDEMWAKIGPLLPEMPTGAKGGRPWRDNREVLEGILCILRTGASWADLVLSNNSSARPGGEACPGVHVEQAPPVLTGLPAGSTS